MLRRLSLCLAAWLVAAGVADAAITITWRASVFQTTNSQSSVAATPTWTPAANALLVCFVVTAYSTAPSDPTSVAGHGQSYTKLTLGTSTLSTTHKLSIWVASAGASPTSAACTATLTSTNGTGDAVVEFEVAGADMSGGATGAIVASNASNTGSGTSETVTLASPGDANNRAMIMGVQLSNNAQSAAGSWTLSGTAGSGNGSMGNWNTPATGVAVAHRADAFDTAGALTGANVSWRMVGIEIKAAAVTGFGRLLSQFRNHLVRP